MDAPLASPHVDPIREGLARGWRVVAGAAGDAVYEADVAIVGTGAGGAMAADILSAAGLRVILIEEGPLRSSSDFRMREADAYPQLYQASAARKTRDKGINILQGRCVGGGTTVNWTSSFRTPPATLAHWAREHGLEGFGEADLAPWFDAVEKRLSIAPWTIAPNANNAALARGAARLGISHGSIRRNVAGCWNLGYCGMGCPTNAKQSMLVTTIPAALDRGATLLTATRALRLVQSGERVTHVECIAMDAAGVAPATRRIDVARPHLHRRRRRHQHAGAAAAQRGARSARARSARRTFLHPTVVSAALMPERIDGYAGAPQTIYSDHFLDATPLDGPLGYKLEAPPVHPILAAITLPGHGEPHARLMREFARHARADRAAARRLQRRRAPAEPCTWPTTAHRCSTIRSTRSCSRRAARVRVDGRDPVRGGRNAGPARARGRRGLFDAGRRARARSRASSSRRSSRPWSPRT